MHNDQPGDVVLRPVSLTALGLLILNDRLLKEIRPGWFTGKLSDFAGLFFMPLLVLALYETGRVLFRRPSWRASRLAFSIATLLIGVSFVLFKTWTPASELYAVMVGMLQWPIWAVAALLQGKTVGGLAQASVFVDVTDLVALVALFGSYLYGRDRTVVRSTQTSSPTAT